MTERCFPPSAPQKGIDNRGEGHARVSDPINVLSLLNILLSHTYIFLTQESDMQDTGYTCSNICIAHALVCCASSRLSTSSCAALLRMSSMSSSFRVATSP